MPWSVGVMTGVGIVAAAISAGVSVVAWRHRSDRAAISFLALTVTLTMWSLLYGIQLGFTSLETQLRWQRLTLAVAGVVPTAWLVFTLRYSGGGGQLTRERMGVVLAEPVAFVALCLTNPVHNLVWTTASMTPVLDGQVPALTFGIGYAIHIAYAYLIVGIGVVRLVIFGSQVSPTYQRQVTLLVAGAIPPFISHIAFTLGASPVPNLDLTPFLFALTGLLFGLALFKFKLLDLTPIARLQALAETGDGLVVLDTSKTIVDLIGVASSVLPARTAVGAEATDAFQESDIATVDGTYRTAMVDGQRRTYQLQVSPLVDHQDTRTGTMILLRDITGLHESEQRLEVSNRVLRHNLRNDMGIILGYAETLEHQLSGPNAAHARTIRETAEGFLELSEKARRVTKLSEFSHEPDTTVDLRHQIADLIDELQAAHPTVNFEIHRPSSAVLQGVPPNVIQIALRNVLENAVGHNQSSSPRVSVTVTADPTETSIEIADNGHGIPKLERSVIGTGFETPLEHSQGMGLWLTYWCVTLADGTIEFESSSDGTTVTMRFQTTAE